MTSPLRVDLAGGWLDVPRFAISGGFIVNCAISPLVRMCPDGRLVMDNGHHIHSGAGLGGSAAWHALCGRNALAEELAAGCGWQDPAVLAETGLCIWASGPEPVLVHRESGEWLKGKMALYWTGATHSTADICSRKRDLNAIYSAGVMAFRAVRSQSIMALADAVDASYEQQLEEGMAPLPVFGLAQKYCGAGHGGYAVYLFEDQVQRDRAVEKRGLMPVEPYSK